MLVQTIDLYECDPTKNTECNKGNCQIYGGPCHETTMEEYKMENEIRYYLKMIRDCMTVEDEYIAAFKPSYIVTAVKLPTGAIELAVNDKNIKEKIDYILDAYDEEMCLKTNPNIVMQNAMVV